MTEEEQKAKGTDTVGETPKEEEKPEEKPEEKKDVVQQAQELYDKLHPLVQEGKELVARKVLGGDSEAGQPIAEEKKEETAQEYTARISKEGYPT